MFTVANAFFYGSFMINKTTNSKEPIEPCTGKDRYIQVQGQIYFELI